MGFGSFSFVIITQAVFNEAKHENLSKVHLNKDKSVLPGFGILNNRRKLLVVSHQDKALGIEQRTQTYWLTDLRRLIHDAEVKASAAENWMLHTHTGGGHNQLQKKNVVIFTVINN